MSEDNKQLNSEEVRAKVIEAYEIEDNEDNEGLIEKLTAKEIENQKNLSKTIEQKAKYRELGVKAGILDPVTFEPIEKKPEGEPLKNNTEQNGLSREEVIFYAKGGSEEDLALAKKIAALDGISILAAMEDDLYKSKIAAREEEARVKANSVGASSGSPTAGGHKTKPISEMTREEHMEYVKSKIS